MYWAMRHRYFPPSGAGAGAAAGGKGKAGGMSQLKMQAMALGGAGGAVVAKELAVSPAAVVVSREKEKLALQELNDRLVILMYLRHTAR